MENFRKNVKKYNIHKDFKFIFTKNLDNLSGLQKDFNNFAQILYFEIFSLARLGEANLQECPRRNFEWEIYLTRFIRGRNQPPREFPRVMINSEINVGPGLDVTQPETLK